MQEKVSVNGVEKKPSWLRVKMPSGKLFVQTNSALGDLCTVCKSAKCPNLGKCWSEGRATFMILGDVCTRNCRFCAVKKGVPTPIDFSEPERLALAAKKMNLKFVVITSVTRDDISDGGAKHFANTIFAIRKEIPDAKIEVLTPDFMGDTKALDIVLDANPDVFNHNLETVKELQKTIRIKASYEVSLEVLKYASKKNKAIKSGIMLGLGETKEQVENCLCDMRKSNVSILTIGQYMKASPANIDIVRYAELDEFEYYKNFALKLGFEKVQSSPFTRSSFNAQETFEC